jgi:hypothetical protein
LATRDGVDPAALARQVLSEHHLELRRAHAVRVTVEDAFVSMVRAEERAAAQA